MTGERWQWVSEPARLLSGGRAPVLWWVKAAARHNSWYKGRHHLRGRSVHNQRRQSSGPARQQQVETGM